MKEIEFFHKFIINKNGIPFSEKRHSGTIEIEINGKALNISGDKEGLIALAAKLIEVANCDVNGYHKHLDGVELPNVSIKPKGLEINIDRSATWV